MNAASGEAEYASAVAYLLELKSRGVSLGLERMERFLAALGNPHRAVPCIHIAGTNGKGSVAAMLEAIFRAAGWRTGLYTSPHLVRLGERVQVSRQLLSEQQIASYVRELRAVVANLENAYGAGAVPSYFEFMTALAFLHFARSDCGISLIEVGLGGRLDATNLVVPEVSVITSIGLDHSEILGGTLAEIAAEKAGIVKYGRPVVMGNLPAQAEGVVRQIARARDARLLSVAAEFGDAGSVYPRTNLEGDYQRWNAATATLAARAVGEKFSLSEDLIERALMQVDWPGRWQRFSIDCRRVILDTSHNADGATTLERNLAQLIAATGRAPVVVVGALGETRARPLLNVVGRYAREVYLVVPAQGRASTFQQLEALMPPEFAGRVRRATIPELFPRFQICEAGQPGDSVVVTGSIYLAGEVLARLEPKRGASEAHLQDF